MPKKEKIIFPFASTHYSIFDSKNSSLTANLLLNNAKYNKLKRIFNKHKVIRFKTTYKLLAFVE